MSLYDFRAAFTAAQIRKRAFPPLPSDSYFDSVAAACFCLVQRFVRPFEKDMLGIAFGEMGHAHTNGQGFDIIKFVSGGQIADPFRKPFCPLQIRLRENQNKLVSPQRIR